MQQTVMETDPNAHEASDLHWCRQKHQPLVLYLDEPTPVIHTTAGDGN